MIRTAFSVDMIIATVPLQNIVTKSAFDSIVLTATINGVLPIFSEELIVSGQTLYNIIAICPGQFIRLGCSNNLAHCSPLGFNRSISLRLRVEDIKNSKDIQLKVGNPPAETAGGSLGRSDFQGRLEETGTGDMLRQPDSSEFTPRRVKFRDARSLTGQGLTFCASGRWQPDYRYHQVF